ncbi:hypothetical protein [Aurantivibrio infirmus]
MPNWFTLPGWPCWALAVQADACARLAQKKHREKQDEEFEG